MGVLSVNMIVFSNGVFFFNQKTAYEMRISDWSSDVCSSDLGGTWRPVSPTSPGCDRTAFLCVHVPAAPEQARCLQTRWRSSAANGQRWKRSEERRVGKECIRTGSYRW